MRVWIVNPFDNLPLEGFRPQRYWLMAEAFVEAGHHVVYWTSDFSHASKKPRVIDDPKKWPDGYPPVSNGTLTVNTVLTPPYSRNVSLARVISHRRLARNWLDCASKEEKKPDVVIASLPPIRLPLFAKAYADSVGAKFVVDIMDDWPGTFYRLLPRRLRWLGPLLFSGSRRHARYLYANADLVTGVADRYAELALSAGAKRYRRFYHGIENSSTVPPPLSTAAESLLYLGNLGRTYDLRTAIEAVALDPQLTLDIAGKGEQEDSLRAFATEKGVADRVRFHGYLAEDGLAALAAKCAFGLIPMSDESCVGVPYKLADYARYGLFMLSSLRGESAALLERHRCGVLYDFGDPRSLIGKLKREVEERSKPTVEVGQRNLNASGHLPPDFNSLLSELDASRIYRSYVAEVQKL